MSFKINKLPYSYDSMEPYIDKTTMEIHYTKHHMNYFNNLNKTLKDINLKHENIEKLLENNIDNKSIRNNGGGFYNHNLFWDILKPVNSCCEVNNISSILENNIKINFGSLDNFKKKFHEFALNCFGSGWTWLCLTNNKKLEISSTSNQDNPLMFNINSSIKKYPILGLDVWEHAYYLKYQNRRFDYINAFWHIVDWKKVSNKYELIISNL